jgi:hypothetical protein
VYDRDSIGLLIVNLALSMAAPSLIQCEHTLSVSDPGTTDDHSQSQLAIHSLDEHSPACRPEIPLSSTKKRPIALIDLIIKPNHAGLPSMDISRLIGRLTARADVIAWQETAETKLLPVNGGTQDI